MPHYWRILLKTIFWFTTALVLYLALSPAQALPSTGWDKMNHVLAFGTLGALAAVAWPARVPRSLVLLVGYGILIEVLQSFTPTRSPELLDVLADSVGLLLVAGLWKAGAALARARAQ